MEETGNHKVVQLKTRMSKAMALLPHAQAKTALAGGTTESDEVVFWTGLEI